MTLEETVGQLFWCGWGEPPETGPREYNHHARFLVEELGVGGVVVFTRNLGTPDEIAALTDEIRRNAKIPPLIGIDQEGGRVSRLPLPGLVFPGNMALGLLDRTDLTWEVARAIGVQLAALGIDVDFAPSVDVNNNPLNPIIGVRSFGSDPEVVTRHGIAAVGGFRSAGILPVIKHFPGHGNTGKDSHLELPEQAAARPLLEAVELAPFRAAIDAGAPAVMTTHIMFPALDPDLPATLSRRILTGILREELGFKGLVITDCMEMQGIADNWGPEEAAILALDAGADMLLVCHTQDTQTRMYRAVLEAVRRGRLDEQRLQKSAARVAHARDLTASIRNAAYVPGRVGATDHRNLESDLADQSLAQVGKVQADAIPLDRRVPVWVSGAPKAAAALVTALQTAGFTANTGPADALQAGTSQLIWVALPNDPFSGGVPDAATLKLLAQHPRALVVAAQEPYCLAHYPSNVPRVAIWSSQPAQLNALARWLTGQRTGPLVQLTLPE